MGAVLVTGAYGFIGEGYCRHLEALGVPYVGAVRERRADEARDEILAVGDFAIADWTASLIAHEVDCVVHLAARSHRLRDDAPDPLAAYRRANVEVTSRLLAAAGATGVRRLVFTSSVKVHGQYTAPGVIWRESDPVDPQDDYARSKAEAEAWVRDVGESAARPRSQLGMGPGGDVAMVPGGGSGKPNAGTPGIRGRVLETVILRLPLTYGPGVKANFAALVDAVRAHRPLPLGAIRNLRSLLGLANACSALDAARTHPGAAGETFLVCDGDDVSTPELAAAIGEALGVRPRLWSVPPWLLTGLSALALRRADARRLLESLAIDSDKIRRSLAWTPPSTLHDELVRLAQSLPPLHR